MNQDVNGKLACTECGTVYLDFPTKLDSDTLILCRSCGKQLGRWGELEADFIAQGGQDGVFEMHDGQIIRKE
ncbi:hypothetical protein B5P45_07285 [Phyllobacterium zundukense]|uniref:Uncharacterized protein n=1 Tax=Phyllobacterium zundukense TaxID=1867719 RepID=A0A2N9W167_9HYPH|nr:hypothetical protein BLM14_22635 [Phyllobacterium zundukense]PIO45485.1 hypothetical protein B5P45_07285 [Phyllobacterium zundukense]